MEDEKMLRRKMEIMMRCHQAEKRAVRNMLGLLEKKIVSLQMEKDQQKTMFNYLQEVGATWSSKRLEPSGGFYFYELESSARTSGYSDMHGREMHHNLMPTSVDLSIEKRDSLSCR